MTPLFGHGFGHPLPCPKCLGNEFYHQALCPLNPFVSTAMFEPKMPERGQIWQHVKSGDFYTVIGLARNPEGLVEVVYHGTYGQPHWPPLFTQGIDRWSQEIAKNTPRFKCTGNGHVNSPYLNPLAPQPITGEVSE